MEQWGIVIAFFGTMAALVTSFKALPQAERARYQRYFQIWVVIIAVGTSLQIASIIFR